MQLRTGSRLTILIKRILLLVFSCPIIKSTIAKAIANKNMAARNIIKSHYNYDYSKI